MAVLATVLTVTVSGCGDAEPAAAPSTTAPSAATSVTASTMTGAPPSDLPASPSAPPSPTVDKQITVTVAKRKVIPPTGRVEVAKGSLVRITVTSDVADNIHVHGYDLKVDLPAGTAGSLQFRADRSGLFEVETHETKLVLFQLVVR